MMCFGRSCRLQKLLYTDTELTEQTFSSMERDIYDIFYMEYSELILAFNCSLEHMKSKVSIFDGKKENAISTSGFQDK